jgi:steroid 5-alpha reductase family enzyme
MLDNIPLEFAIPAAIFLWLILLVMILRVRFRLNRALKERPSLKIYDEKTKSWIAPEPQEIFDQDEIKKEEAQ